MHASWTTTDSCYDSSFDLLGRRVAPKNMDNGLKLYDFKSRAGQQEEDDDKALGSHVPLVMAEMEWAVLLPAVSLFVARGVGPLVT